MTPDLSQLTNVELKQFISEHRNDHHQFHLALEEVMRRRDPDAKSYPPLSSVADLEQAEAIFREKLNLPEHDRPV